MFQLQVTFGSMIVEHYKETPEYSVDQILNALGGAMSLVMGLTLFTLAELVELLLGFLSDTFYWLPIKRR